MITKVLTERFAKAATELQEIVLKDIVPAGADPATYLQQPGARLVHDDGNREEQLWIGDRLVGLIRLSIEHLDGGIRLRCTWHHRPPFMDLIDKIPTSDLPAVRDQINRILDHRY